MNANHNQGCVILGGGGHCVVVIDALLSRGLIPSGILDSDPSRWGSNIFDIPILGGDDLLSGCKRRGIDGFAIGIGSTSASILRRELFLRGLQCELSPVRVVHASAILSPFAMFGRGCQIMAGAIINARALLGDNVLVNTGAIIEHDCVVEAHAHISPGCRIAGAVHIGESAHIGIGAVVRQGIHVGCRATVAAGAVVVKDVPDDTLVLGVPARPRGQEVWEVR